MGDSRMPQRQLMVLRLHTGTMLPQSKGFELQERRVLTVLLCFSQVGIGTALSELRVCQMGGMPSACTAAASSCGYTGCNNVGYSLWHKVTMLLYETYMPL